MHTEEYDGGLAGPSVTVEAPPLKHLAATCRCLEGALDGGDGGCLRCGSGLYHSPAEVRALEEEFRWSLLAERIAQLSDRAAGRRGIEALTRREVSGNLAIAAKPHQHWNPERARIVGASGYPPQWPGSGTSESRLDSLHRRPESPSRPISRARPGASRTVAARGARRRSATGGVRAGDRRHLARGRRGRRPMGGVGRRLEDAAAATNAAMPGVGHPLERMSIALRLWAGCLSAAKTIAEETLSGVNTPADREHSFRNYIDPHAAADPVFRAGVEAAPAFLALRSQPCCLDGVPAESSVRRYANRCSEDGGEAPDQ